MTTPPLAGGNSYDADRKAPNVVVKSEPIDVEYGDDDAMIQPVVAACHDPVLASGSFEDNSIDGVQFAQDEHGDTTECSSSFGDSGFESNTESDACIMEVDSPLFSHINVDNTTAAPRIVRKKKVTADWMKFIGLEKWRCQWLELRMKDLLSQVAKYDKELAIINHEKYLKLEMIKGDNGKSDLSLLDLPRYDRNTMNRRKRKRYEDDTDISLYIKEHQFFSYYKHENGKSKLDNEKSKVENEKTGASNEVLITDDFVVLDAEDTQNSNSESEENDELLEQHSLSEILLAIECTQSRITNLQSYLNEAYSKANTQSSQKKRNSNGLYKKNEVCKPFGAHEDEITIEMLFDAKNPLINSHTERIYKESDDDVLLDNEAAIEEEFWEFERVIRGHAK